MKRLCIGLVLLCLAGTASAQLGSFSDSPACCQLTTSLVQDVVYGQDSSGDERFLGGETPPPNIHFLIDTSGSMQELPQVVNSDHYNFLVNLSTPGGCVNPRLDAFSASRGWNPNHVYPVPDPGTGTSGDPGFPNLFQDSKFYPYHAWGDSSSPAPAWNSAEEACKDQIPDWNGTGAAEYAACRQCLSTKGYFKTTRLLYDPDNPATRAFILWGRFLNFNPPKYVTARAVLKSVLKNIKRARVSMSYFLGNSPYSKLVLPAGLTAKTNPSCSETAANGNAFEGYRDYYIASINNLVFESSTPLARSLINVGYYFTSSEDVYRNDFGFGSTGYFYPVDFRNEALTSQNRSVCWGCQKSSVIIITDGEPNNDELNAASKMSTLPATLRILNGGPVYCPDSAPCGNGTRRDHGTNNPVPDTSYTNDLANYYLDDVAKLLHDQDLQRNVPPVIGDFDTSGKQSLRIHTIGFGINSNLLKNTALVGGGRYYTSDDAASLKQALQELVNTLDVEVRPAPLAPASVDKQPVNGVASALVPRLQPSASQTSPWKGFLYRFNLTQEKLAGCDPLNPAAGGDLNFDGDCDDTHLIDADGAVAVESTERGFVKLVSPQTPARPFWEAGQRLKLSSSPSTRWQTRRIFTIIDTNSDGKIDGRDTPVEFTEFNAPQLREYLGISQNPNGCADLAAKLGLATLPPDDCARLVIRWYRGADALHSDPAQREYDRSFLLHDIFHSSPISVEPPRPKSSCGLSTQCLPTLFSGQTELTAGYPLPTFPWEGDAYDKYVSEAGNRDKVVLVGSNGGMLHAFHNGQSVGVDPATGQPLYDAGTGQELWAFIPPDLLPRLRPNLGKHAYFVDGTPMVRDVWLDGTAGEPADGRKQWQEFRTVAVVGSGRGGAHRFALDLTRLLSLEPGESTARTPNQPGDFLWMWPQPCDRLALQVGESFSNFAPQPPPMGPVALTPEADDSLRALYGQGNAGVVAPWRINNTLARERWVVALNGGYDPQQTRGRGMALVDLATGHTVWSFFHEDGKGRSEHLRYSIAAGLSLADVGNSQLSGADSDALFDTAMVGDYGGQLWTVRFWQPGQWDASNQQVSNWHAARAFRVANLAGRTASPEALRGPFSTIAANVVQPDTGVLRTYVGTGDSQNLIDVGTNCRLGNPRACAEQGCWAQSVLEVRRAGALASASVTQYSGYSLGSADSFQSYAGPSCAGAKVTLWWDYDSGGTCGNNAFGSIESVCDGDSTTWNCRTARNDWQQLNLTQPTAPYPQRFYGLWSYGGAPNRTFNTDTEAYIFDSQLLTDADLVNVGQFGLDGNVVHPQVDASPLGKGWYIPYAFPAERTGSAPTVIDGCVLWSSFEPGTAPGATCPSLGSNTSRLYQADVLSGRASCALGFYTPSSGTWARFLPFTTQVSLSAPVPQRMELNAEFHTRATLSTPLGTVSPGNASGTPFFSLPVTEGPP